jgi:hypothetical protein
MSRKILKTSFDNTQPDPISSFRDWDAFSDPRAVRLNSKPIKELVIRPIVIQVEDNHPEQAPPGLTDFFENQHFQIASAKLKSSLEVFSKDIEFVPVTLNYDGKLIEKKYFILHPLRRIQGLDRNRSVFEEDEGFICGISKVVLDESKFEGVDWAILDEGCPVIVSEAVQRAMNNSGCIGFQFTEVSDFTL